MREQQWCHLGGLCTIRRKGRFPSKTSHFIWKTCTYMNYSILSCRGHIVFGRFVLISLTITKGLSHWGSLLSIGPNNLPQLSLISLNTSMSSTILLKPRRVFFHFLSECKILFSLEKIMYPSNKMLQISHYVCVVFYEDFYSINCVKYYWLEETRKGTTFGAAIFFFYNIWGTFSESFKLSCREN